MVEQQIGNQTITCHWHPTVSTGCHAANVAPHVYPMPGTGSGRYQVPGVRTSQPLPTFDVRPTNYFRALAAAAVIVVLGVILWVLAGAYIGGLAFVVMPIAVGYAAGDLISRAVNLKRSRGLMYIAGGTVVLTLIISLSLLGGPRFISLWSILSTCGGVLIAVGRVRL